MSAPVRSLPALFDAPATPDPRGLGGLLVLVQSKPRPLPLAEVRVRASIAGDVCRTVVEQRFPFERIADAHRVVDTGHKRGAVVVTLSAG